MEKIIRLGTRGSPLALIQAQIVKDSILNFCSKGPEKYEIEIVPLRTSGDWRPETREQSFLELGGTKGLFTKEIEEALLSGAIDMAVHSMKDVSVHVPDGLCYPAIMKREDPRDAFLSPVAPTLAEMPSGARIGTSSLRRKAQILAARPDVVVIPLRGNVDTRLRKLSTGEADATVLAVAGLNRLGVSERISSIFDTGTVLPAAAQGCLGIQTRENDPFARELAASLNHDESQKCCIAERALLRQLDGSCRTPIAAYAQIDQEGRMRLDALVAKKDGSAVIRRSLAGQASDADKIGDELGVMIRGETPNGFYDE